MCGPLAAIGFGLQAASQVAGFAGQQQATDDYNAAARQNAINASLAMTHKTEDEQRRYAYDTKNNISQAYDAIMKARQAKGTAIASAGTAGLDASSLSVDSILSNIGNQEAESVNNFQAKQDDMEDAYRSRTRGYYYEAMGRINSMPFKRGPSPLGLGLGIATAGFNTIQNSPTAKNWLGFTE